MRIHRIPYFVDRFNSCIDGRIKTNGKISSGNILIDSAGNANAWDIKFFAEFHSAAKRTITTDNDKTIDPSSFQVFIPLLTAFIIEVLFATGGLEYRSTALNNIGNRTGFHFMDIIFDETLVTPHDPIYFEAIINALTLMDSDSGIHTGLI